VRIVAFVLNAYRDLMNLSSHDVLNAIKKLCGRFTLLWGLFLKGLDSILPIIVPPQAHSIVHPKLLRQRTNQSLKKPPLKNLWNNNKLVCIYMDALSASIFILHKDFKEIRHYGVSGCCLLLD
jgi:hypothetical protein